MMIPVLLLLNLPACLKKKLFILNSAKQKAPVRPSCHPAIMCQQGFQVLWNVLTTVTRRMKK